MHNRKKRRVFRVTKLKELTIREALNNMIKLFYSDKTEKSYYIFPVLTNFTTLQPYFKSSYHVHPIYHIVFLFKGSGALELDKHTIALSEGDIVLINPNEKHIFSTENSELYYYALNFMLIDCRDGKEVLENCINFYDIRHRNRMELEMENAPLEDIFDIKISSSSIIYNKDSWKAVKKDIQFFHGTVEKFLKDIYLEKMDTYALKDYLMEVYDFLFSAYKNYFIVSEDIRKRYEEPIILQILLYLEQNVGGKLNLGDLAKELNYNPSYISRLFKIKMKLTISEYLNMIKIRKASELLRNSGKSITEIAMELGYNSSQHFSRSFKAVKHITPTEYRNNTEYF
jgi:YesN/AraC family two-component response regulator